jgi:glycosyltransferase involved in cell wall biosynthesis
MSDTRSDKNKNISGRKEAVKVCIFTTGHGAFDTRIFHKQAITLVKAGYDVTIIARNDKDEVVDGVKIVAISRSRNRFQRMFMFTFHILYLALKQKADIYHFHDSELLPIGFLLRILTNAKVIYDIHEDYPGAIRSKSWIPIFMRSFLSKLYSFAEKTGLLVLSGIVVAGDDILTHFPKSSKVALVRNYPRIDKIKPVSRENKSQENAIVLIYIGAMGKKRGIEEIVAAVNTLNGRAKLILLGSFPDPQFESEIRECAGDGVQLVGRVPYDEVFHFMSQADVGLVCFHPSPNNIAAASRNNKLFEYMAAGLPVISSNFPAWSEIVDGDNCGATVDSMSSQDICAAIERLAENIELVREMGQNGRKAVLEKYNWELESHKLLRLYRGLC